MILAINLICTSKESGSKTYCVNFLKSLSDFRILKKYKKIFIFANKTNLLNFRLNFSKNVKIIEVNSIYSESIFKILYDQIIFPILLLILKVDKVFCPLNYAPLILMFTKVKIILGIHSNLIWIYPTLFPGGMFKRFIIKFLMISSIKIASKIIFCSKNSKKEFLKFFKKYKKKCYHAYLGCDHMIYKKKKVIKKSIILVNSSITKYHDIILILKAYTYLLKTKKKIPKLFIVTQILDLNYYKEIINFIKKNNLNSKITILKNIPNNKIYLLYKKAILSINSSKLESFGFPSIESMILKCPVILSNYKTFFEVNKNGALYFKDNNLISLVNALYQLLFSEQKRSIMIKRGVKISKLYTWKKNCTKTFKIINKI